MTTPEPQVGPEAAEQEAFAEYLDAWCDLANMPNASERSVEQEAVAQQAECRLRQAETAHLDACLVAHPERQAILDAAGPEPEAAPEIEP